MLGMSALPTQDTSIALEDWIPSPEDRLIIDTEVNIGYLFHEVGGFTSFPVVTGQERNVYYIGRYYNAKTPEREWKIESLDVKSPSVTFGPTGRFFRLYDNGERTPYGIHGHRYALEMLADEMRYRSMGCIIVSESILDLLEKTYQVNGDFLSIKSTDQNPILGIENGGEGGIRTLGSVSRPTH